MRRGFLFLSFLLCGSFIFSARVSCASGPTVVPQYIEKSTTWTKEKSPYIIQSNVYVQAKLTLEPGTVVKFSYAAFSLYINAEFSARGTKNEKIVFTSIHDDSDGVDSDKDFTNPRPSQTPDWEKININPDVKVEFDNTVVKYGRVALYSIGSSANWKNLTIRNSEISHASTGIYMENLEPVIDGNLITKNSSGIVAFINNGFDRLTTASNNSFIGNGLYGVYGYNSVNRSKPAVDARNNWWGNISGPSPTGSGKGNEANSFVLFDPWLGKDPFAGPDPVIVIPGIMGSWEVNGKWKIDPILHAYENLKKAMENSGYTEGENMFDFPYQWRNSNIENAKLLRDAVAVVKEKTGRPKVDIIAHSMGGLIAREYVESDYYNNDIDQLITLGTPQAGSPKAYLIWEAGEADSYLEDKILKIIFNREAKKAGYENIFYYAREKIPSLQELLPSYNYIFDLDLNIPRIYPEKYPRNIFLENLNSSGKINLLQRVEFDNIFGKTNKKSTIGGYNVINAPAFGDYWKHGYPKDFNIPWSSDGLVYTAGDGTVPESSATYFKGDHNIEINASHNRIPTEAQQDVIELLTGKRPASKITSEGPEIKEILLVQVYCPVDITVIDPYGKVVGKNQNDIEGAVYINNGDDEEFLTIPNPEDGEYKIITEGTGTGDYTIETTKISQDKDTGEAVEATATITGTAEPDKQEENKIEIDGGKVKKVEPLTLSPKKKEEEKSNIEIPQVVPAVPESSQNQTKIQQLDSLKDSVRDFFKTKQITKKGERDFLLGWLGNIRVYLKRRQLMERKSKTSQKAYGKLQKKIVGHCNYLIRHINKNSPKKIDRSAADILIEELNSLKL